MTTLAEGMLPQMLMTAGAVLALVVVMRSLRQRMRRHGDTDLTGAERVQNARQTHEMQGDLRQMMVELEDLTRRFSSQLDAKSMRLERLLEEADQKIEQLKQLRDLTGDAPQNKQHIADPAEPAEPVDPLAVEIYRLSDAGKRPRDIARQLDEHVGKVELILNLRQG